MESFGTVAPDRLTRMSLDLKRQLIAQLVESSRLLRNYIDHRAKGRGTTRAQWIVLFRLRQQEGLSQVDLADVLELQPISLVRLLDRLVEHGLLERRPDPRDRRANRLFLTTSRPPAGRRSRQPARLHRRPMCCSDIPAERDRRPASRRSATSRSASRASPSARRTSRPSKRPSSDRSVDAHVACSRMVSTSDCHARIDVVHIARDRSRERNRERTMDELNGRMIACQILITGLIARVANDSARSAALSHRLSRRDQSRGEGRQHRRHGEHRSRAAGRAADRR